MATPQSERVTVARVLRPQGRRGEVACEILTDFPERLTRLSFVQLSNENGEPRKVAVRSCWLSQSRGGQAIFHFEGTDSISDAEKLAGLEVQIPFADRVELPRGSYFISDLIGCQVHTADEKLVGFVADVQFTGDGVAGTPILAVDSARGEVLIPLAEEICISVDTAAKRVVIVPPEGLLDLNLSSSSE
ncbi:MAG TPA: ribosome maturation factor RimM [Candidatus Acidoferrales bacterium]|nr:ribosome maturation factor RimM [Candidatus Acidoferrales bacterium]